MHVSALILTRNEEANLPACLRSLSWCDDIVVLDSFSTDGTVATAERQGARVVQRTFDDFAGQRNWALSHVDFKYGWVLHLDADEVVTPQLRAEIDMLPANPGEILAWRIPSRTFFFGKCLRFAALPSLQVRLTPAREFRFKQVGHGQKEDIDPSKVGCVTSPYLHFPFSKGLGEWFERHNRYSSQEALSAIEHRRRREYDWSGLLSLDPGRRRPALKSLSYRLPFRHVLRFVYMYVLRLGFLDGYSGYLYCRFLALYEFMTTLKIRELERNGRQ